MERGGFVSVFVDVSKEFSSGVNVGWLVKLVGVIGVEVYGDVG